MSVFKRSLVVFFVLMASQFGFAAETTKLGYISTEKIYRESKVAKDAWARVDKEFKDRQDVLKKKQKELSILQKRLSEDGLDASTRLKLENEFSVLNGQYRTQAQIFTEDYNLRRNEEFAAIQERANRLIKEIAQKDGYDLILQEAVYVNPKFDLTKKLIDRLDSLDQ